MKKEEQKLIQRTAQTYLEQLRGTGASFMFIGDEGNCFTLGGRRIFHSCSYYVRNDSIPYCRGDC